MSRPSLNRALNRAGLTVIPFRVRSHVAKRVDGAEAVTAALSAFAVDAPEVRHSLRELSAAVLRVGC